jgi:hypothetical protein
VNDERRQENSKSHEEGSNTATTALLDQSVQPQRYGCDNETRDDQRNARFEEFLLGGVHE